MSTLKEDAQIIRDETKKKANTAVRIGNMFLNIIEELSKKLSTGSLAQGTGSSTDTAMSQDAVTKELNKKLSTGSLAQETGSGTTTAMSQDAVTKELAKKQNLLQNGITIRTINGQSILGPGNLTLSGGTGGTVIPLKKGTETNYNTTTTTEAAGGELYYNSSTVKIYYRVGSVNYTDWNVEGFYTRADVCDPNGTPNTGAFYLIEDELNVFNGTKMVSVYNGAKVHYLNGIGTIVSGSGNDRLKSALNGVAAFCDAVEGHDTIFYDLLYGCVVVLSAQITGIEDTNKTVQVAGYIQHYNSDTLGIVFHGTFAVNKTAGEVLSMESWKRENITVSGSGGGISDAPSDGKSYLRRNGEWKSDDTIYWMGFADIFVKLKSGQSISSGQYTPPIDNPTDIGKYVLYGYYGGSINDEGYIPLSYYREYDAESSKYKLWISFLLKDSHYRFSIDIGNQDSWGNIDTSDYKATVIGG